MIYQSAANTIKIPNMATFSLEAQGLGWDLTFEAEVEAKERLKRTHSKVKGFLRTG